MAANKITLELTDEQARDLIRAASVHARDMAGVGRPENIGKVKRLDALRLEIETLVDKAT